MGHLLKIAMALLATLLYGCSSSTHKEQTPSSESVASNQPLPGIAVKQGPERFGDRLNISGDFNGDGRTDTVFESYISSLTRSETSKELDSMDWENNVGLIIKNKPVCRLYSSIDGVDTFIVTREPQQSGISLFENLGDLNGDKGDEIGYIINWA